MANSYPALIPGLRSPSETIQGIVWFGRMLDKIRLAEQGRLPADWLPARGQKMFEFIDLDEGRLDAGQSG